MSERTSPILEGFFEIFGDWNDVRDRLFRRTKEDGGDKPMPRSSRGEDPETEAEICAHFVRNISGYTCGVSQYGQAYVAFRLSCPPRFEEAVGTEKAKAVLRQMACDAVEPFKGSVAVWRKWPRVHRSHGALFLDFRFHLMTVDELEALAPTD